jgi:hypothetical protein
MVQKQYVIERKDWLDAAVAAFWPHKLIERLANTLKIEVPEGYQDETGFHFGSPPARKQNT